MADSASTSKAIAAAASATSTTTKEQQSTRHEYVNTSVLKKKIACYKPCPFFSHQDQNDDGEQKQQHSSSSRFDIQWIPSNQIQGSLFQQNESIVKEKGITLTATTTKTKTNSKEKIKIQLLAEENNLSPGIPIAVSEKYEHQEKDEKRRFSKTEFTCLNMDTVSASLALLHLIENEKENEKGDNNNKNNFKVAAHNFANAQTAGGYYAASDFAQAQEENLCRVIPELWGSLKLSNSYPIPINTTIVSKNVTVLRNPMSKELLVCQLLIPPQPSSQNEKEEDKCEENDDDTAASASTEKHENNKEKQQQHLNGLGQINILTMAMCICDGRRPAGGWCSEKSEWYIDVSLRIRSLLNAAVQSGFTHLVLGACGAGAFGNNPSSVAEVSKRMLESEEFRGCFHTIVFAIIDPVGTGNLRPFAEVIKNLK